MLKITVVRNKMEIKIGHPHTLIIRDKKFKISTIIGNMST